MHKLLFFFPGTAGNIAYWSDVSSLGSLPCILYGDDESVKIASKEDAGDDDPIFEVNTCQLPGVS